MTPTILYRARYRVYDRWLTGAFATTTEAKIAMRPPGGRHRATP